MKSLWCWKFRVILREDVLHLIDMSCPGELWEEMIFREGVRWCCISYEMLCLYVYGEERQVVDEVIGGGKCCSRFYDRPEQLGIK